MSDKPESWHEMNVRLFHELQKLKAASRKQPETRPAQTQTKVRPPGCRRPTKSGRSPPESSRWCAVGSARIGDWFRSCTRPRGPGQLPARSVEGQQRQGDQGRCRCLQAGRSDGEGGTAEEVTAAQGIEGPPARTPHRRGLLELN